MMSTEEALNTLKQSSTVTGDSVFNHLSELLRHVLASKPNNAVDVLETSFLLKATRYISRENTGFLREGRDPKDVEAVASFLELFATKEPDPVVPDDPKPKEKKAAAKADAEDTETDTETETETVAETEEAPPSEFQSENLYADSVFMDAVGVGLGRSETHMIMLALKRLGDDRALGITSLRFFGKFFGTRRNYYVFESLGSREGGAEEEETVPEGNEDGETAAKEKPLKQEPLTFPPNVKTEVPVEENSGPNVNVYWVCNRLEEKCVKLPPVTPLQISIARKCKKFLTGDLDAQVTAIPPYPGVEKNFLRAQIARISAGTQLALDGFYTASGGDDDPSTGEITANEEWTRPADSAINTLAAWVHCQAYIRKAGRCADYEKAEEEGGEEESVSAPTETETEEGTEGSEPTAGEEKQDENEAPAPDEPEEIPELLGTVENDKDMVDGVKPWSISMSSSISSFRNQVVSLRSLLWPGAFAVSTGTKFSNIYVGFGFKNSDYVPPVPPRMQKESKGHFVESTELPLQPQEQPESATEGEGSEEGGTTTEGEDTETEETE